MKSLDAYFEKLNGSSSSNSAEKQTPEQQAAEAVAAPAAAAASASASAEPAASPAASATSTAPSAAANASSSAEKKIVTKDFQALSSLNSYFDKLNAGKEKKADADSSAAPAASQASAATASSTAQADVSSKGAEAEKMEKAEKVGKAEESGGSKELKAEEVEELIRRIVEDVEKKKGSGALDSKVSDLTLEAIMGPRNLLDDWISAKAAVSAPTAVYTLVAINIAVFLFELASPEAVPGVITTSLPALLAAKVNPLIEAGEWWRLLTPSLLHAGIIHLSVGTFFLLGLGSVLEFAIGPLGLLAVYFSSGLAGNITSFLQTPDVTVGGTGPVYGVAAAYAAFLIKNREVIGTETADSNVRESLIIAALFALFANPLPIDPSTHAGAALAGFLFGSIAAPTMRKVKISNEEAAKRQQGLLNSLLSQKTNEESYELVVEPADSKKLATAFGATMALSLALFQLSQGIPLDVDLLQSLPSADGDVWLADDLSLHNPLRRLERMGCGWLAVLLEWEGVVIEDDSVFERQAWIALAEEEGRAQPPVWILKRAEGMKNEQVIREVLCWSRDFMTVRRLSQRKEELYEQFQGGCYRLLPGSREFLDTLKRCKIPVAIVSTRPARYLERAVEAVGMEGFFDAVISADDVQRGKPDPEMYQYAAQRLQFIPERCIVIGSSNSTIEAAHDAYMKVVTVAGRHPVYELGAADLVVRKLDMLSVVDLKNLADLDSPEFTPPPELEPELEPETKRTGVGTL
ncbi:unnamed protein product [Closterium sp. NIES-64]|nr:unnamed protein product [Closterium sp. NIES-64]